MEPGKVSTQWTYGEPYKIANFLRNKIIRRTLFRERPRLLLGIQGISRILRLTYFLRRENTGTI